MRCYGGRDCLQNDGRCPAPVDTVPGKVARAHPLGRGEARRNSPSLHSSTASRGRPRWAPYRQPEEELRFIARPLPEALLSIDVDAQDSLHASDVALAAGLKEIDHLGLEADGPTAGAGG